MTSFLASFLHGETPSRPIGVMRIIVGTAALLKLTQIAPLLFRAQV